MNISSLVFDTPSLEEKSSIFEKSLQNSLFEPLSDQLFFPYDLNIFTENFNNIMEKPLEANKKEKNLNNAIPSNESFNLFSDGPNNNNENKIFLSKKKTSINYSKHIFKKNRNNFFEKLIDERNNNESSIHYIDNFNIFKEINPIFEDRFSSKEDKEFTKHQFSSRNDSLLIKFKVIIGKTFINCLNKILKKLLKRRIKFYSFNYKKFTLNVSYNKNIFWLHEKIKNLLIYGGEKNQIKNKKSLTILENKRGNEKIEQIKNVLDLTYEKLIEKFYESKYFELLKNDQKIIEMDKNFKVVMGKSLLDKNGFINFIYSRKGNVMKVVKEKEINNNDKKSN